jgi:hypothetical protein|tara:strand:- start:389 stop:646 length:258 start_codon:yes stop_codon:yes gene_type:complete
VKILSELFNFIDFFVTAASIIGIPLTILYYFRSGNSNKEKLSNDKGNGLGQIWKKMSLSMKVLIVTVEVVILLATLYALYYFGFA